MRLTDILKQTKNQLSLEKPSEPRTKVSEKTSEKPAEKVVARIPDAPKTYGQAISACRGLLEAMKTYPPEELIDFRTSVPEFLLDIIFLSLNRDDKILSLATRSVPDFYLPGHMVNTTIFALAIAAAKKYSLETLKKFGLFAFWHELETTLKFLPDHFADEKDLIQKHPLERKTSFGEILEEIPAYQEILANTVPVIENWTGKLFAEPEKISDCIQIILLADVYEMVTHYRPNRERIIPHEALKKIAASSEIFGKDNTRQMIERFSLFPPGSYVVMASGEIARVVKTNPQAPTRPVLELVLDSSHKRVTSPTVIDLGNNPVYLVSKAIDELKIDGIEKNTLLELKYRRWWLKK